MARWNYVKGAHDLGGGACAFDFLEPMAHMVMRARP